MVKTPHEALHQVFRHDSRLFTRALDSVLGISFPDVHSVSVINCDLTEILPIERRVDTPLMVETIDGPHIVVIESQTAKDASRARSWPYYVAYLNNKFECPVTLLVITADVDTAGWAREPMCVGLAEWSTLILKPLVIGPDNSPAILDATQAKSDVMMSVLSALTHRNNPKADAILGALAQALDSVDLPTATFLAEFTEVGLTESPAADIWRKLMTTMQLPYKSKLHQQWNAEGRLEEAAHSVISVLKARGFSVPAELANRIHAIPEIAVLHSLLPKAVIVESAEDLLPPD